MEKVTLNHEQFLHFTGWSEKHATKKTQAERIAKLESMGMEQILLEGRGKKATYSFMVPSGFWRMLIIQNMSYSAVGADYIDYLINGQDVLNTDHGILVKFSVEIHDELAQKHGLEVESVKKTCQRIKSYLNGHDYIGTDMDSTKTHRVRVGDTWITDTKAIDYDQKARDIWKSYFESRLRAYQEIDPTATKLPLDEFREEISQKYRFEMKEELGVDYYRVAKKHKVTDRLTNDINYVRWAFMQSMNLSVVLEELNRRQAIYREEKEARNTPAPTPKPSLLTAKEREALQKKTEAIQFFQEHPAPKLSEEEALQKKQYIHNALAELFGWEKN